MSNLLKAKNSLFIIIIVIIIIHYHYYYLMSYLPKIKNLLFIIIIIIIIVYILKALMSFCQSNSVHYVTTCECMGEMPSGSSTCCYNHFKIVSRYLLVRVIQQLGRVLHHLVVCQVFLHLSCWVCLTQCLYSIPVSVDTTSMISRAGWDFYTDTQTWSTHHGGYFLWIFQEWVDTLVFFLPEIRYC